MAWFRRNKFRLHPSHDFVAGTSSSRGHGRPRHPNLPYRHFRAHIIAIRYHFPDIMSDGYRCELCIYKSLTSVSEPFEVIVILDLSEHSLGFNRSPASMHQYLVTSQQFSCHCTEFIVPVIHFYDSVICFSLVAHPSVGAMRAVFCTIYAFGGLIAKFTGLLFCSFDYQKNSYIFMPLYQERGRIVVIAEACPPPDMGRGRGPQDTSSAIAGRSRLWEGPE